MTSRAGCLLACLVLCSHACLAQAVTVEDIEAAAAAGKVEKAFGLATELIEQEPDNREALALHGRLAMRCGAYQEAVGSFEAAQFFADTAEAATDLGNALLELGRLNLALASYRHALALDDTVVAAHVGTGRALLQLGSDRSEARLCLESALGIDKDDTDAVLALAEMDVADGRRADARARLDAIVSAHPKEARAWFVLGRLASESGDPARARKCWQQYTSLEPARPETYLLSHNMLPVSPRQVPIRGSYFVYSPDGKRIAYIGAGAEVSQEILVVDAQALREPVRVCQLQGRPFGIAWSPDGSRLAVRCYDRVEDGDRRRWDYSITTVGVGGEDQRVVYSDRYLGMPVFMPDGKRLCFDAQVARQGRVLVTCEDAAGAQPVALAGCPPGTYAQWLDWSRKGDMLVASTFGYAPVRNYNIVLFGEKDMSAPQTIYTTPDALYYPAFTPDSGAVLFLQLDDERSYTLYCLPRDGSAKWPRMMLRGGASPAPPSVSADGKNLLTYQSAGLTIHSLVGLKDQ